MIRINIPPIFSIKFFGYNEILMQIITAIFATSNVSLYIDNIMALNIKFLKFASSSKILF